MKNKIIEMFIYSGVALVWFDICLLAAYIQIASPMCWIMRIYYVLAITTYLYKTISTNTREYRKAAHLQSILRKQRIRESFEVEYEAFRKEMHS